MLLILLLILPSCKILVHTTCSKQTNTYNFYLAQKRTYCQSPFDRFSLNFLVAFLSKEKNEIKQFTLPPF
jgi:hypothetical protein